MTDYARLLKHSGHGQKPRARAAVMPSAVVALRVIVEQSEGAARSARATWGPSSSTETVSLARTFSRRF